MDSSSSLQRRRPAPLHLHTRPSVDASAQSNSSSSPSTTGHNAAAEGMPSSAPMAVQMSDDGQSQRGSFSHTAQPNGPSGYLSPYGGGNTSFPPPALPHSHSMPISASATSSGYTSGQGYSNSSYAQGNAPYSASSATFGGAPMTSSHSAAPYSSTASSYGNTDGPGQLTQTHSAPAVPLSAGLASSVSTPAYPTYSSQAPYPSGLPSYRSSASGPSSSPYGYHLHTPHYQPFAYEGQGSGASPYDRSDFAQQQQQGEREHYRNLGVTPSGQRYPPFAPKVPLVDRPFKCDECVQSFNRNHDLKRHKRIHLAVKPFSCDKCGKQFSRKDALRRHWLVKGCRGDEEASGVNTHFSGPPPALSPPTPTTPSHNSSSQSVSSNAHSTQQNSYFPPMSAPPAMSRQYSSGTVLVTPKDELHSHGQYQSAKGAIAREDPRHQSISGGQWTGNGNVSPTSGTAGQPSYKYLSAPRSASFTVGADYGRAKDEYGNQSAVGEYRTGQYGTPTSAGFPARHSLGPGLTSMTSWNGESRNGVQGQNGRSEPHVFREPFPTSIDRSEQNSSQWSSVEMQQSASSTSTPGLAPGRAESMSYSLSYPGAQGENPLPSARMSIAEHNQPQHEDDQSGGQWQRWHRPSFPFPLRNGNIYDEPTQQNGRQQHAAAGGPDRPQAIGVEAAS